MRSIYGSSILPRGLFLLVFCTILSLLDNSSVLRHTHVGENGAHCGADGLDGTLHNSGPDALDHGNSQVEDPQHGGQEPDVDDGDEGKDQGPDKGCWNSQQGWEDSVQPELGLGKQDVSQSPDRFEALSTQWFSQNIVKINLQEIWNQSRSLLNESRTALVVPESWSADFKSFLINWLCAWWSQCCANSWIL